MPFNRAVHLIKLGKKPVWPEIKDGFGLYKAARDLGFLAPAGMGDMVAIPLSQILPAVGMPGSPIETWQEAALVAKICAAFKAGFDEGKLPLSIPPWERD